MKEFFYKYKTEIKIVGGFLAGVIILLTLSLGSQVFVVNP